MCEQKNISPKYLIWFLIALTGVVTVFLSVIVWSNVQFRKSRTDLVEALNTHIVNTKGLLDASHGMYVNHQKCVIEGLYNLVDSISKQPIKNQKVLISSLKSCLNEITDIEGTLSDSEMRHEFEMMKNDISVTLEYLSSHLQLHIDKMNNAVSTFELWAAVLTIIFLVFSFYSLYKVDELLKQGRDGVEYIEKLKKDGEVSVRLFNKKSRESLKGLREHIKTSDEELNSLLLQKYQLLEESFKDSINKSQKMVDDALCNFSEYKSQVEAEKKELIKQMTQLDEKSKIVLSKLEIISENISPDCQKEQNG